MWQFVGALVFSLQLVLGMAAQPQPPALTISLRDVNGIGVTGVTVSVRDGSGAHELARGVTDSQGQAAIAFLPIPEVRVAIIGSLADGTPLLLRGDDAQGICFFLASEHETMALRVDTDGTVLPDPEVAVALELGGSTDDLPPEAPVAMETALSTALVAPSPTSTAQEVATIAEAHAAASAVRLWQLVLAVGSVLLLGGGAATLMLLRERL
jgi:hypothetical protein